VRERREMKDDGKRENKKNVYHSNNTS
jgi:hypothetical protein